VTGRHAALAAAALLATAGCNIGGGELELTDAQQVIAGMKLGPSELRMVGGVDHADRIYKLGEPIALTLQVNKNANAAVLRVLPNGRTTQLFPSKEHPAAAVAANSVISVPGGVADMAGTVLFEFIAAGPGDSFLFDKKRAEEGTRVELGATTRSLAKEIVLSLKPGPGRDTAAAHLAVRVEAP
jgi:hypothetical protein